MDTVDLHSDRALVNAESSWRSFARRKRAFEFLVAILGLGLALIFSLIEVHDRKLLSHGYL